MLVRILAFISLVIHSPKHTEMACVHEHVGWASAQCTSIRAQDITSQNP